MSNIALLHHDWEWTEMRMVEEFRKHHINVSTHDVRTAGLDELKDKDFVINRVYASVANRDYPAVLKTLNLVEKLHSTGVTCLAGPRGSRADYDKYYAYERQSGAGIPVPLSRRLSSEDPGSMQAELMENAVDWNYPVILKPNTGGRGKDVYRIAEAAEITGLVDQILTDRQGSQYGGGWIAQEFIPSARAYDCRIAVFFGRVVHAYRRTLMATGDHTPWMASRSLGSRCEEHALNQEEIDLAIQATKTIEADYNMLDVTFGDDGPVVIENNITPNFQKGVEAEGLEIFLEAIAKHASEVNISNSANP
jgi:gamma-F420-2:alpha-L-glutamate ligase